MFFPIYTIGLLIRNMKEINQRDNSWEYCDCTIIQPFRQNKIGYWGNDIRGNERKDCYEKKSDTYTNVFVALSIRFHTAVCRRTPLYTLSIGIHALTYKTYKTCFIKICREQFIYDYYISFLWNLPFHVRRGWRSWWMRFLGTPKRETHSPHTLCSTRLRKSVRHTAEPLMWNIWSHIWGGTPCWSEGIGKRTK